MPFPDIDPIALQLGPLVIRWYALSYIAGIVLAYLYIGKLNARFPYFNEKARDDLITYAVIGIILGGRIGYVLFYNFPYFMEHPSDALKIWQGGMSFHGGLLGIFAAFWLYARRHKLHWLRIMDYLAAATPIGLCLGRIANFINGELYGRVTDVSWGIVFPHAGGLPRHPSQLYQAATEGLLLFVLLYVLIRTTNIMRYRGAVGGLFLAGYGVARFVMEFFRMPDPQLGFLFGQWLTMGQLLCVPMIVAGAWLMLRSKRYPVS
ncbi:MAG: prolipoprotein diacylglyceryl transferase [Alphaproteobacteria bacterium]|nr:prolipoprotein diacylglyceryl transferase [Alphaproteobacteria bacterium]